MSFTPNSTSSGSSSASSGRVYNFQELLKLSQPGNGKTNTKCVKTMGSMGSIGFPVPVLDSFFDIVRVPADYYGYHPTTTSNVKSMDRDDGSSCWSSSDSLSPLDSSSVDSSEAEEDVDTGMSGALTVEFERSTSTSTSTSNTNANANANANANSTGLTSSSPSPSTSNLISRSYLYGCGESVRTDLSSGKLRELRRAVRALSVDLSTLHKLNHLHQLQ